MTGLGDDARAILARHRDGLVEAELGAARNWSAIMRRIDRDEPALTIDDAPTRTPARVRWSVAAIAVLAVGAAAYVGVRSELADAGPDARRTDAAAYGADDGEQPWLVADQSDAPRRSAPTTKDPRPPAPVAPTIAPAPDTATPAPTPEPRRSRPRPVESKSPTPAPADVGADELADIRMLARARAALRDGKPDAAVELLRAHARRRPTSEFAPERDMLIVVALCDADRPADARTAAAAFRRDHPGSHLLAQVARACEAR